MQTPTSVSGSPPQTYDSGAVVAYLKNVHTGFFFVQSGVYAYPSADVASAALAADKKVQVASRALGVAITAPSIGEESYAIGQSVRGEYHLYWRRCNYVFSIGVQSVPSVATATALAKLVDAAAVGL